MGRHIFIEVIVDDDGRFVPNDFDDNINEYLQNSKVENVNWRLLDDDCKQDVPILEMFNKAFDAEIE